MSDSGIVVRRAAPFCALLLAALVSAQAAPAQSPNTAAMVVVVTDQNGAIVRDAKVSVVNNATGEAREVVSGGDGSATVAALPLTGTYTVGVSSICSLRSGRPSCGSARTPSAVP